jgi:uncharacterized protein
MLTSYNLKEKGYFMHTANYQRWQHICLKKALTSRRVLTLVGCRQCGKTTLARELCDSETIYRTLDDAALLASALTDPDGFVKHGDELMIIDEVQHAPGLLRAVKKNVDEHQKPGRFLLTGSADIQSLPTVNESLAGRVQKIRLRPLVQGEIHQGKANFFEYAFKQNFSALTINVHDDKDAYIQYALKGGYPEVLRLSDPKEVRRWYQDYLDALLERDLKDITNIKRHDSMRDLVHVLAAWSSQFMDLTAIGAGLSLTRDTINTYINALEALYLVERVKPWTKIEYERVNKRDKLFMTDTGLMSAILKWHFDNVRLEGKRNGKLLETFVFTQLATLVDIDSDCHLYHYRDRDQHEIDFIIENADDALLGIEVKAGSVVTQDSFKHLKWFKQHLAQDRTFIGIVLYSGSHILPFGTGMWAVPINALWHSTAESS